jgi:hypothetical protein
VKAFVQGNHVVGGTPVRNPVHLSMRSSLRTAVLALLPAGLLALGAGVASAQVAGTTTHASESDAVTFGLWGPVGLVAVALGVVGMAAGVVRQRRSIRAKACQAQSAGGCVTAMAESMLIHSAQSDAARAESGHQPDSTRPRLSPAPRV